MNREVYRFLLQTFGRRPGIWAGVASEIIRTLCQRVWVTIVVAQIAAKLAAHDVAAAKHYVLLFFGVYIFGAAIGIIGDLIAIRAEDDEYEHVEIRFYKKLTNKDMSFYRDNQTGYLVSLFRHHADNGLLLVRQIRTEVVRAFVSLVVPVVVLGIVDMRLGLVALAILIVQMLYIGWSSSKVNKYRKWTHEIYRKMTGEVSDHITNIVAYKSGGVDAKAQSRVKALAHEETEAYWIRRKITMMLDAPRELITAAGVTAAFLVVLGHTTDNPTTVGLVILTITYMFQIIRSVSELPALTTNHDDMITKIHPTLQYFEKAYETIRDPEQPKPLAIKRGAISLKNVGFSYPLHHGQKNTVPVFSDLNLNIKGGEQVGVVGLSGAGKSTLVSLLMRFDDVDSGAITIDGTDIRDVRQAELHQNIAYVPQEPLLFHNTIRENIAYFSDDSTDKDVIKAAKAAHAHGFISKLPNGYDTVVGERGVKLSGGQKQRVVIARAILKNTKIIIFDEATSALDTESEKIIQAALPQIIGRQTAIVIAHRLSTIAGLERILVMHEGQIVETGTHDELLSLKGRYYSLWQKQITSGNHTKERLK